MHAGDWIGAGSRAAMVAVMSEHSEAGQRQHRYVHGHQRLLVNPAQGNQNGSGQQLYFARILLQHPCRTNGSRDRRKVLVALHLGCWRCKYGGVQQRTRLPPT